MPRKLGWVWIFILAESIMQKLNSMKENENASGIGLTSYFPIFHCPLEVPCSSLILQIWVLEEQTTSSMDLQRRRRATAIADTVKHAYLLFLLRSSDYFSRTWPIRCQGNVTRFSLHGWRISTTKSHYYTQVRETSFLAFRIEENK